LLSRNRKGRGGAGDLFVWEGGLVACVGEGRGGERADKPLRRIPEPKTHSGLQESGVNGTWGGGDSNGPVQKKRLKNSKQNKSQQSKGVESNATETN